MADTRRYDLIIVGAGPVGLSLAAALCDALAGISIAVVDRRPLEIPGDGRAFAISAGVRKVFEAIGVWDGMAGAANPVRAMKITDSGETDLSRPLFLSFEGEVAPGAPFAHMVPQSACVGALLEVTAGRIDAIAPVGVSGFAADPSGARITLTDGAELIAPLVVAADGGRSALREMAGIGVFAHDYGQDGLVATIGHTMAHEDTAYEHFRPAGPFASLPLKGNRSSLVWTETRSRAQAIKAMEGDALAHEIETAMGSSLGAVEVLDTVQSFPLRLGIARRFVAPRLALVGDAAHVIHPIAGQGLNLGLKDIAALAECVADAIRCGIDHGGQGVLGRYERARGVDTGLMALATDGLNRLFSNDIAPVRAVRDFGLSAVDRIGPLKSALIGHAAGVRSELRLLNGLPL